MLPAVRPHVRQEPEERPMLKLTDDAATMISHLAEDRHLPAGAGLRIADREDHEALAMSMVETAEPHDIVLVERDARVFLAPVAGIRLDGQTLDARTNDVGSAFFVQP